MGKDNKLHTGAVSPKTLELIREICNDNAFCRFSLGGDTALVLYLGHRESNDIEMYTDLPFDSDEIARHLENRYGAKIAGIGVNVVMCLISDIEVSFSTTDIIRPWDRQNRRQ